MNIESPTLEGEIEWIFQNTINFRNQYLHFIDEVRGRSVPDFIILHSIGIYYHHKTDYPNYINSLDYELCNPSAWKISSDLLIFRAMPGVSNPVASRLLD